MLKTSPNLPAVLFAVVALVTSSTTTAADKKGGGKKKGSFSAPAPIEAKLDFPKPSPEKQFPELKIYDAQGRPWRSARENWEGARSRVAADAAWAGWLKSERAAVDAWMAKHRDRIEWIAGWSNDFVSPKDGSKLTYTDAIPGEETDHFASPSDPRVELTPKLKAAWVRIWREKHAETMDRAAQLFRLTGDRRYADWAAGQLDFYAENYLKWEPQRQGARLFWQCLTEGVNLITYAQTVRLLGDFASPARKQMWLEKFFRPEVAVLDENFPRILNITCWLRGAAAQVALVFGDDAMWRRSIDGPFGIREQVTQGITSDYLWFEQSLGYNSYVVDALTSLFTAAGLHGRAAELAHEMNTVENLALSTTYLRFPTGQLPNPSDTKGLLFAPDKKLLASIARVFPTTIGLAELPGRRDWATLLDPPAPAPPNAGKLPPVTSRSLKSSRMAVLRQGQWQVFFHYGQLPIKSHLQAEVLNFSAFFGDTDITHDPGTVGYGSPLHKNYYAVGLNHNVPLVNGAGQEEPPQAGELIEFNPAQSRVTAAQPTYRSDARARRTLVIEGDKLVDTATIETTKGESKQLGLALHLQGKVRLPAEFKADAAFAKDRPEAFGYWENVRAASFRDSAVFDVDFGKLTMRVTLAVPGEFRVWHGSAPDAPPARRDSFYVETTAKAATFTTTFAPAPR